MRRIDSAEYLAWPSDRLVFHNTPLPDAGRELGRWYDVDLQIGDSALASRHLTATFSVEGRYEMLQLLASSLGA